MVPAQHPCGRNVPAAGCRRIVFPPSHLALCSQDVSDERHPIGIGSRADAALRAVVRQRVIIDGVPGLRIRVGSANASQLVAKNRMVNGVAVRVVGIPVEPVIALEESVVRADHV